MVIAFLVDYQTPTNDYTKILQNNIEAGVCNYIRANPIKQVEIRLLFPNIIDIAGCCWFENTDSCLGNVTSG